jgi:CheY-like chemotaxis protein
MANILVVDDESSMRRLVRTTLETRGHAVRLAASGRAALAAVVDARPELIVLDWMLPDMSGLDVCHGVRADPSTAQIPIIFLTAIDAVGNKVAGLEAGGDDYVTKPFEPQELLARVNVQLRKSAERNQISPLTQLPGNALISRAIQDRLDEPATPFALFYFDLNDFKSYNDFFGFSWGDQLLKMLAEVIRDALRTHGGPGAFLGHVGGDDFVGIAGPESIAAVCDQAIAEFDRRAADLCAAAGAPDGFVTQDRGGRTRRFGPPSLSIGVISNDRPVFTSHLEVGQFAAYVKKQAKQREGSAYFVDRARVDRPNLVETEV